MFDSVQYKLIYTIALGTIGRSRPDENVHTSRERPPSVCFTTLAPELCTHSQQRVAIAFHSFMDYANGEVTGINEHNISGIIVPQRLYTTPGPNPLLTMPRVAFFVNRAPGLHLQDALQTAGAALDNAGSIPDIPPVGGQRASFRILVCCTCCAESKTVLILAFSGPGMILGTL